MREIHQGQRSLQKPHRKAGYMGALFLYVTGEFFLAIRGGPYMTPSFLSSTIVMVDPIMLSFCVHQTTGHKKTANPEGLSGFGVVMG